MTWHKPSYWAQGQLFIPNPKGSLAAPYCLRLNLKLYTYMLGWKPGVGKRQQGDWMEKNKGGGADTWPLACLHERLNSQKRREERKTKIKRMPRPSPQHPEPELYFLWRRCGFWVAWHSHYWAPKNWSKTRPLCRVCLKKKRFIGGTTCRAVESSSLVRNWADLIW